MKSKSLVRLTKVWAMALGSPEMAYRLARRGFGLPLSTDLYYVIHNANWAIDWVGHYITSHIQSQFDWSTHLTTTPYTLVNHIIHFGDLWSALSSIKFQPHRYNKVVATIFHGDRDETEPALAHMVDQFVEYSANLDRVVTACRIMEKRLLSWGIAPERVLRIPLGVDTAHFKPATTASHLSARRELGIPEGSICIGSFQKDGAGWQEGLEPKLIKGPDIFLQVIGQLHSHYPLHVLLTGPARGYVKQGLERLGVPYTHVFLTNYLDIVTYYHALDLYLITSREEGGPQAVLEALACGVPLVSTRVGLAPDILEHGRNGLLAASEDVAALTEYVATLIETPQKRQNLAKQGLAGIYRYDWQSIAASYYQDLYQPLLAV